MRNILLLLLIVPLSACEPTLLAEFEDKPVVNCYLEDGVSPIVNISKIIAFRDDVTYSDEDISKLDITKVVQRHMMCHQCLLINRTSTTEVIPARRNDRPQVRTCIVKSTGCIDSDIMNK